jgi:2-methylcitrate dehydratase PrpD
VGLPGLRHGVGFVHDLAWVDLPAPVRERARVAVLDTLAAAYAGSTLPIGAVVSAVARRQLGAGDGPGVRVLGDGRRASVVGAAFAGAAMTDAFDAHDGHPLCKGHAGATVVPSALAFADDCALADWEELCCWIVVGYEIGTRAGVALHGSTSVHHSSGAWNALAAAALGCRALGLSAAATEHALGIAEYYGPRSPLMRVAAHPSMVKDGSGAGALAGTLAAYLAADGFTGAPAELVTEGEPWDDLGRRWRILEHYVKPDPVCRWAQPAVEAARTLRRRHPDLASGGVDRVVVETFAEAVQLRCREPDGTDAAQYSVTFPLAVALLHGDLGVARISGPGLRDAEVLALSRRIEAVRVPEYDAVFPAERWARVRVHTTDGRVLESGPHTAVGDPDRPLPESVWTDKVSNLAGLVLPDARVETLLATARPGHGDLARFLDAALAAP